MLFLDHRIRERPARQFLAIKRSCFNPNGENRVTGSSVLDSKSACQGLRVVYLLSI
ncbi:hypothetical protein ASPSYDRAFT_42649 [Aspergillus sydowii CBS 593.65]|uniref:Uncharacterized protein n=1 Tax=Aspergillus sydowii CBS 593.65 TaxID=1036612 RepID=A0A1L9TN71_9EURO|nr:uncharacterized protein ASPSYDRAFT_42649 [Aspergillus sydowii CBS 593.65]OJJ60851.1 hypothetical protein ASPSYDRAFT_42649 [Aspergillus sydowii CBS 593.65]